MLIDKTTTKQLSFRNRENENKKFHVIRAANAKFHPFLTTVLGMFQDS